MIGYFNTLSLPKKHQQNPNDGKIIKKSNSKHTYCDFSRVVHGMDLKKRNVNT